MAEIAVEVSDREALSHLQLLAEQADGFVSESKGIDGVTLCTVIMTLGPLVINGIVKIVQAQIRAKRHVRLKIDGIEITGISDDTLIEVLREREKQAQGR
jgi:hypothetical protein